MFNILKNLSQNFVHSPFAHRGYHDCNGSFEGGKGPENSRCSIIHAIQNGLGVEIDVRFTKDYKPTAGCIALKEKDFLVMLKLIKKNSKIKIF